MQINDRTSHERKVFAYLTEEEIHEILVQEVLKRMDWFPPRDRVRVKVVISTKPRPGTSGFTVYSEVDITEDLSPCVKEA